MGNMLSVGEISTLVSNSTTKPVQKQSVYICKYCKHKISVSTEKECTKIFSNAGCEARETGHYYEPK
jgi:hypothetical protein